MAEKARAADGAKAGAGGSVFYCKSESEASFVRYVLINFPQYNTDVGHARCVVPAVKTPRNTAAAGL